MSNWVFSSYINKANTSASLLINIDGLSRDIIKLQQMRVQTSRWFSSCAESDALTRRGGPHMIW